MLVNTHYALTQTEVRNSHALVQCHFFGVMLVIWTFTSLLPPTVSRLLAISNPLEFLWLGSTNPSFPVNKLECSTLNSLYQHLRSCWYLDSFCNANREYTFMNWLYHPRAPLARFAGEGQRISCAIKHRSMTRQKNQFLVSSPQYTCSFLATMNTCKVQTLFTLT